MNLPRHRGNENRRAAGGYAAPDLNGIAAENQARHVPGFLLEVQFFERTVIFLFFHLHFIDVADFALERLDGFGPVNRLNMQSRLPKNFTADGLVAAPSGVFPLF